MLGGLMMVGCRGRSPKGGRAGKGPQGSSFAIKPGENFTVPDLNLTMIWVEPGTFTMGSPTSEEGRNSRYETQHQVTLTKGFYLGKYELTQAQWEKGDGEQPKQCQGYEPPGGGMFRGTMQLPFARSSRRWRRRQAEYPKAWLINCLPRPNGNTPAVRGRPRCIRGVTQSTPPMRITIKMLM